MHSIVVDASALVEHLLFPTHEKGLGAVIREYSPRLCVPQIFDAEVLSAVRSLWMRGAVAAPRARAMLEFCRSLPVVGYPHRPLLMAAWGRRENFSAPDALYVALAESLGVSLLTADLRLADAVRRFTPVPVLAREP